MATRQRRKRPKDARKGLRRAPGPGPWNVTAPDVFTRSENTEELFGARTLQEELAREEAGAVRGPVDAERRKSVRKLARVQPLADGSLVTGMKALPYTCLLYTSPSPRDRG